MSELNEELLIDEDDDTEHELVIEEADEEALLQEDDDDDIDDDQDVLDLTAGVELPLIETEQNKQNNSDSAISNSNNNNNNNNEANQHQIPNLSFSIQGNSRRQYYRPKYNNNKFQQQKRPFNNNNLNQNRQHYQRRNNTVLINPFFKGVVPVNNNARLLWDNPPPQQQQQQNNRPPVWQQSQLPATNNLQFQPPAATATTTNLQFQPPQLQIFQGTPPQIFPPPQNIIYSGHYFGTANAQNHPNVYLNQNMHPQAPTQQIQLNVPSSHNNWNGYYPVPTFAQGSSVNSYNNNNMNYTLSQQQQRPNNNNNYQFPPPQPLMNNANFSSARFLHNNNNNQNNKVLTSTSALMMGMNKNKPPLRERLGVKKLHQGKNNLTKKMMDNNNRTKVVKEVTVTNVTTVQIEDDAETRDLRVKIEEQKRKREQILKWKEERRINKNRASSKNNETEEYPQQVKKMITSPNKRFSNKVHHQNKIFRKPVLQTVQQSNEIINLSGGAISNNNNETDIQVDEKHLSTFLTGRKVLVKDDNLLSTRQVLIRNLSTNTSDKRIYQICNNIGEVQKLNRNLKEQQATITFKSVASAHAFFKKYQRYMLDLSMIEVKLNADESEDGPIII